MTRNHNKAKMANEHTAGVNKKIVNKHDTDNVNPKYRDLRQLENKLKKWENELKMCESKIEDSENETRRLQDYIQTLEFRNYELETTIKTLRRKINLLETEKVSPDGCPQIPVTETSDTDKLILGVREQVTKYEMGNVVRQLINMEVMDSSEGYMYEYSRQDTITAQRQSYNSPAQNEHLTEQLVVNPGINYQQTQSPETIARPKTTEVPNFRGSESQRLFSGCNPVRRYDNNTGGVQLQRSMWVSAFGH